MNRQIREVHGLFLFEYLQQDARVDLKVYTHPVGGDSPGELKVHIPLTKYDIEQIIASLELMERELRW